MSTTRELFTLFQIESYSVAVCWLCLHIAVIFRVQSLYENEVAVSTACNVEFHKYLSSRTYILVAKKCT